MLRFAIRIGGESSGQRRDWQDHVSYVREAEKLGIDYCWSAEAWGQDAATPLAYLAAVTSKVILGTRIMQVSARRPSMTAMTAMTLAALSDDRFVLGLGVSGPQVVEGLQGVSFADPVGRLSEHLEIVRRALRGDPIEFEGRHYKLPLTGSESGKVLRMAQPAVPGLPIFVAALGDRTLRLAGEKADGWFATCFLPEHAGLFFEQIEVGLQRAGRSRDSFTCEAGGHVAFGDDVAELGAVARRALAFRLGGMGSADKNFYNRAYCRMGHEDVAKRVQDLWLDGRSEAAIQQVPMDLVQQGNFIGTDDMVQERLGAFEAAGVNILTLMPAGGTTSEKLDTLERLVEVNSRRLAASHEEGT